jgi:hypothetical protein
MLMAGWHPERGCEDFYKAVWEDLLVRERLLKHLSKMPGWAEIELRLK